MTGNLLFDSLISLAGIALMVLIAWALFPKRAEPLTKDKIIDRLALDEPDFDPRDLLVDDAGRAALIAGSGGDFVAVKRLGLDLVTWRFRRGEARVDAEDGELRISFGDIALSALAISAKGALDWAARLEGQSGEGAALSADETAPAR